MHNPATAVGAESVSALFRILQLSSSNLPVGGYTFSQGLEYAIDAGWLKDEADIREWISQVSHLSLTYSDLPLIRRQYDCIARSDWQASKHWNSVALAIRETHELQLADLAMGQALLRLAKSMKVSLPAYCLDTSGRISFTTAYSLTASYLGVLQHEACVAYCWTVLENQVLAATKLLPLGQTAAQLLLLELSDELQSSLDCSEEISDDDIGLSLLGLTMASAKHETQYTRLYRS